jgi:Trk K+ transport system NAD-binding subunit
MRARIIAYAPLMRIIVLGAGHVGAALVDALHEDHDVVVVDADDDRLSLFRNRYDVRTIHGDGTSNSTICTLPSANTSVWRAAGPPSRTTRRWSGSSAASA